ncbi:OLC1v1029686C2 [Oldenlandia corymbosa var. corymbosa]|uniref:AT-hook motif nuclear-localized protein n=1 Tax=Oldenlandia corymbosa var. corymbosa TaxID=529605 RepID=A0AAV1CFA6_OLDCO|nr:OLC1v1029686C2 [Oldenlandia corymbosa var. corymbosa]
MDGREGMALSGSAAYYFNRGGGVGGSASGSNVGGGGSMNQSGVGLASPHGFKTLSNPNNISVQSNYGGGGGGGGGVPIMGSAYHVENPSASYPHGGITMSMASSISPSETGKKKRGRPRKYAPDGANMKLGLSPMSSKPSPESLTPGGSRKNRGRPPGSGWKQRLAPLGDWMNSTAGLAFTPHVIHVAVGEDIAAKIMSFAQQRPRALCILSATGIVSAVTLRQPTTTSTMTYEGRFEILCLSGSYLLAESGGPRNRTGGLSISVCSTDGQVFGGAIGGKLVASTPAQVCLLFMLSCYQIFCFKFACLLFNVLCFSWCCQNYFVFLSEPWLGSERR